VERVQYAGLPSSQWYDRVATYCPRGASSVPAFIIKGGLEAGKTFVEALELHTHVANLGDARSLVVHPASTTHSQLTETEQLTTGVDPGLVRLSVGIETAEDIIGDLEAGFAAAR
jgi:O-acetylhomoserine (thiol)-lyase